MKLGSRNVENMMIGDRQIGKVYKGSQVVWEKSGLPSGYTRVQYLESTGTQYIDTGFIPSVNTSIDISYAWAGTNQPSIAGIIYHGQSGLVSSGIGIWNDDTYGFQFGKFHTGETKNQTPKTVYFDKDKKVVDGVITNRNVELEYKAPVYSKGMSLFALTFTNSNFIYYSKSKIYYCKLYDNGIPQRDFIPCLDPNNRPCMYDLVTQQPFYNQGTGEFLYA